MNIRIFFMKANIYLHNSSLTNYTYQIEAVWNLTSNSVLYELLISNIKFVGAVIIPHHHKKKLAILHNLKIKLDGQPTANIIEDNQVVDMKSLIIRFLLQATIKWGMVCI